MGWVVCYVWGFVVGVNFSKRNQVGWVEGRGRTDTWAGGIFSFPLTKDWFLFKFVQKGGGGGWVSLLRKRALGRRFVTVGVGKSVYVTFYIERLLECL